MSPPENSQRKRDRNPGNLRFCETQTLTCESKHIKIVFKNCKNKLNLKLLIIICYDFRLIKTKIKKYYVRYEYDADRILHLAFT